MFSGIDHTAAFVCSHVFSAAAPVRLVVHESDGDWQFLCGQEHAEDELPHVVGIGHLQERDATLTQVVDLEPGWEAYRAGMESGWSRQCIEWNQARPACSRTTGALLAKGG